MKLLVSCQSCHRQFDATGKSIGETFHCHCGSVVRVVEPKLMDAAVVKCSNCGGAREQGSVSCGYCSADFTLIDKDMNAMCPNCCARISSKAQFCHHCGDRVLIEELAGEVTNLPCPLAHENGVFLNSRRLGELKLSALECPQCAGLFLGNETFDQLCDQAVRESMPKFAKSGSERWKSQAGPIYRKCPYCQKIMTRRNYGKKSGVIIDCCALHGIWFDDDELRRILRFLTDGGGRKNLPQYQNAFDGGKHGYPMIRKQEGPLPDGTQPPPLPGSLPPVNNQYPTSNMPPTSGQSRRSSDFDIDDLFGGLLNLFS